MEQRRRQLGAGAAERMPERNRAPVDVETFRVDWQFAQACEHLRREGFIELDQIDLLERKAGDLQRLADRGHRPDAEALRLDAGGGVGDEPRERLQTVLLRKRGGRDDDGGGAVAGLRRVAGGDGAGRVKGGTQRRKRLRGGVAAWTLVHVERHLAHGVPAVPVRRDCDVVLQRRDFFGEASGIDRGNRTLMAAQREGVLFLARDAALARVVLRDEAGREIDVRIAVDERRIGRHLVAAHRHHAHRLGAAGDRRAAEAAHDALGGIRDRLQAGRAKAIDGHRRCAHGHARAQARDARHVQPLLGLGHRASEDDVLDIGGLHSRRAAKRLADDGRCHFVGPHRLERAVRRASHRRSRG